MRKIQHIILYIFLISQINGQDALFSNVYHTPQLINPAINMGFFQDLKLSLKYRDQSNSFKQNNALRSIFAATDFGFDGPGTDRFAMGLNILNDRRNVNNMVSTGAHFNFSYLKDLSTQYSNDKKQYLSFGVQIGILQNKLNTENVWFGNQYNELGFVDFGADNGEPLIDGINSLNTGLLLDVNAGLMWYQKINRKLAWQAGMSLYHLNAAQLSFLADQDIRMNRRFNILGKLNWKINNNLDLIPSTIFITQGNSKLFMAGSDLSFENEELLELDFKLGLHSRAVGGDNQWSFEALILMAEFGYNQFEFGLSYDIIVSSLSNYNNGRGAWELYLSYSIQNERNSNSKRKKNFEEINF